MLNSPPFPILPEDLTTNFLSEKLGRPVNSFETTRIGADRGMFGVIVKIEVVFDDDPGQSFPLTAKFAAPREGSLVSAHRGGLYERELKFYDELSVQTPVSVPIPYGTWYDPDTGNFLLLQEFIEEDLTIDQVHGIGIDDARLVLIEMARLHATWWDDSQLKSLPWLPGLNKKTRVVNLSTNAANGWPLLCEIFEDEFTSDEKVFGKTLANRVKKMLFELGQLPETLTHGDLRADNLLFHLSGEGVTLVDWQGVGRAPASLDLAYFISQCLTIEDRRKYESELLVQYRDELNNAGYLATEDEVRAGYSEAMLYGLVIACSIPLIMDPEEYRASKLAKTMARRSIEAMRDHGQFEKKKREGESL